MALADQFDSIIFDYGGVLVHHQSDADQARMAQVLDMPGEQFTELYWANRLDYDKGVVTAAEYWLDIGRHAKTKIDPAKIDELTDIDTESWMRFDEVMWSWISDLRKTGKSLAILSNMPSDLGEALKTSPDRLTHFDQVTLSYEVHSIKPEPLIYEHCLEGLGTTPERTLFLDDRIENIQGAELLGIHAMQFLDRDHALLQLR